MGGEAAPSTMRQEADFSVLTFSADIKSQCWRTSMEFCSKAQVERCRETPAQLERRWAVFLLLRRATRELEKQI